MTQTSSTFLLLLILPLFPISVFSVKKSKSIDIITEETWKDFVSKNEFSVLFRFNDSDICIKALSNLEYCVIDSEFLGIPWKRIETSENCQLELVTRNGSTVRYSSSLERHKSVFRWIVTEMTCLQKTPLLINIKTFEILLRYFKNFVFIAGAPRKLATLLYVNGDLCFEWKRPLLTIAFYEEDHEIYKYDKEEKDDIHRVLGVKQIPTLVNIVHGIPSFYKGNIKSTLEVLSWIRGTLSINFFEVGANALTSLLKKKDNILVLFHDSKHRVSRNLEAKLEEIETSYDLSTVRVTDIKVARRYGYKELPQLVLFMAGKAVQFKQLNTSQASVEDALEQWIIMKLSIKEKNVIQTISSSAFKKSPNENILMKEHTDAIRMLSMEYARLQTENKKLRDIIMTIRDHLTSSSLNENSENQNESSYLTVECRECLSSAGQALWTCGTLDVECIKNCLGVGSDCYGCLCEIIDSWWPEDAPNCFKKELQAIKNPVYNSDEL